LIEYEIIITIIIWILSIYLGLSSIYLFIFSFCALFYRKKHNFESSDFKSFLVLIPAYKEDNVIINTAIEAQKQNYPLVSIITVNYNHSHVTCELIES